MAGLPGGLQLNFGSNQPSPSAQMTFQAPSSGGSVKEASTSNVPSSSSSSNSGGGSGNQQKQNGGWYNGVQYWAPGQGPSTPSNNAPQLPSLDSLYAPIFSAYDAAKSQIGGYQSQDLNDLTNSYNQNKGLIPGYVSSAQSTIDSNQTALNQQVQSAYDQAARNYQWANAGNLNEYGYNGAYLGANSMAQQEMQREIGAVGNQSIQGQQQIGTQNLDLKNWANTQNATLDQQFSSAKDNLNQYFQNQLMAITNDETATEEQKAAGKTQLLEDVMNQNNAIALQAQNFKNQIALYSTQLGQTGSAQYDLSSLLAQMGAAGQNINQQVSPGNQSFGVATGSTNGPAWQSPSTGQNNDYLNQLIGGTGTQTQIPTSTQIPTAFPGFNG